MPKKFHGKPAYKEFFGRYGIDQTLDFIDILRNFSVESEKTAFTCLISGINFYFCTKINLGGK
jgi:hypothetical protein